jgi:hypothetical protein
MVGKKAPRAAWLVAAVAALSLSGCAGYEDEELATLKTRAPGS